MRQVLLTIAKAILPDRAITWYRRRRATRRYLQALGYEIYHRQVRLDLEDLEGQVAARRDGFTDRLVKDILERTELILQGLDRRIEGLSARHGGQLRDLTAELAALRAEVQALRADLEALEARGIGSRAAVPGD